MRIFFFHITLGFVSKICLSVKARSLIELELYFFDLSVGARHLIKLGLDFDLEELVKFG